MEDVLPLIEIKATDTRLQIQGIELGVVSVPLQVVTLVWIVNWLGYCGH